MGQGGRIIIINWTKHRLIQKKIAGTNMAEWEGNPSKNVPDLIQPYSIKRFYVEWSANIFKKAKEAKPQVVYQLEGMQNCMYITGSSKPKYHFKVNWKDLQRIKGFWLFPFPQYPQAQENQCSFIEWTHDSYQLIALCDFQATLSKYQIQPMIKESRFPFWAQSWMKHLSSVISDIKVRNLMIPGSVHSCASEAYNFSKGSQKQSTSIFEQLNMGARALDLRVSFDPQQKGDRRFLMKCHPKDKSDCTLQTVCKDVVKFLDKSFMEIVILDFSDFLSIGMKFDFVEFISIIDAFLGQRLIPPKFKNQTIGQIWSKLDYQRIIISVNTSSVKHPQFWPLVYRIQSQGPITSVQKFQTFTDSIFKDNQKKFPKRDLYSVIYQQQGVPFKQYLKKVNWAMCPDTATASLGNIIYVEQFHKMQCVYSCVVGNILRQCEILTGKKHTNHILRVRGDKIAPSFSYLDINDDYDEQTKGQTTKKIENDEQTQRKSSTLRFLSLDQDEDKDFDSDQGVPDKEGFIG